MPIILDAEAGKYVLRCVNPHPASSATTMRCMVCEVCGYVEMYAPRATDEMQAS